MNVIEAVVDFFATIISGVLPGLIKKEPSEQKKYYEEIRREIAEALSMYACCFRNPVDLAETRDHILPPLYAEGSHKIRELASKLKALAETMQQSKSDIPISAEKMTDAAGCLYGLSNSFHTPYGTGRCAEDRNAVNNFEKELRTILGLPTRN